VKLDQCAAPAGGTFHSHRVMTTPVAAGSICATTTTAHKAVL
jgi:hypothetical protein